MLFCDLLRMTVLLAGGSATALAAVTVVVCNRAEDTTTLIVAGAWWLAATVIGVIAGRDRRATDAMRKVLSGARTSTTLPTDNPSSVAIARLLPVAVFALVAGGLGFIFPPVPAIGAGYALLAALTWRRREVAVTAIEERDGVRFYVEPGSALEPVKLTRTPGLRREMYYLLMKRESRERLKVGVLAAGAVALVSTGAAGASKLITGGDVKNGSLKFADLSKSTRARLAAAPSRPSLLVSSFSLATSTTRLAVPGSDELQVNTINAEMLVPPPSGFRIRGLSVLSYTSKGGSTDSQFFTLMLNGSETALECSTGIGNSGKCTATGNIKAPVGSRLSVRSTNKSGVTIFATVALSLKPA